MAHIHPQQTGASSSKRGLGTFIALTFALTWGIAALFMFIPDTIDRIFGPAGLGNPLYLLAVFSPGIAGIFVAWLRLGTSGMAGFFRRLRMVRMPAVAWAFLVAGYPAIVYAGAIVSGTVDTTPAFTPWFAVVGALLSALFLAGTNEEFGWRGVALPLLQRRYNPFVSSILLGAIWAIWHLPAFALSGTLQSAWAIGPYFAGLMALSVIMTWLFNESRGSLLIAWLAHFQAMNPLFPDAQPWDSLFYVLAAVAIVIVDRERMFSRGSGVTTLVADDRVSVEEPGPRPVTASAP